MPRYPRIAARDEAQDWTTLQAADSAKLAGITPSGSPSSSNFLRGDGQWAAPTGSSDPGSGRPTAGTEPLWIPGVPLLGRADVTATANTTFYSPFYCRRTVTITAVWANVITGVGGATCRVGVYQAGLDLQPTGTLVGDVGLSLAASGNATGSVSWVLSPGRYVMAYNASAAVTTRGLCGVPSWLTQASFPQLTIQDLTVSATLAALPSTPTAWTTAVTRSMGTGFTLGHNYYAAFIASEA